MRKPTLLPPVLAVLGLVAVASPAAASFFFEGLTPFVTLHCNPTAPGLADPPVMAPAVQDDEGTPGAHSLQGRPPFAAPPCEAPGKYSAPRTWQSGPVPHKVPQK
ncbi:hypothetical protein LAZ40_11710 [Cereibacter sphaeroides]|uniref:hypothetical protein n=1 Tax=Cereibacter sphaeroides TaxID=1063 RepID=UPI001F306195|nr:hypothetical protein [Cereibacter sphaeroides]MCE6959685.1 hypothetical protein [Cereibacter sphaeroides]MCE6974454.1 hypothetical protein [Cereibacter sphaeroides]